MPGAFIYLSMTTYGPNCVEFLKLWIVFSMQFFNALLHTLSMAISLKNLLLISFLPLYRKTGVIYE